MLLFGSRARGDSEGHSDTELIAVGTTQADAAAVAAALAEAQPGDDLISLSLEAWQGKDRSRHPTWRVIRAEPIPLLKRER